MKHKEKDDRPTEFKFVFKKNKNEVLAERFIPASNLEQAWNAFNYVVTKSSDIEDVHVECIYKFDEYKSGDQWVEVFKHP